jgi:hypothetical protein
MTQNDKIKAVSSAFQDIVWMAIRYAHGRHTYAPDMVRGAISRYQKAFPDWKPTKDATIKYDKRIYDEPCAHPSDSLHDLVNKGVIPDIDVQFSPLQMMYEKNMKLIFEIERLEKENMSLRRKLYSHDDDDEGC